MISHCWKTNNCAMQHTCEILLVVCGCTIAGTLNKYFNRPPRPQVHKGQEKKIPTRKQLRPHCLWRRLCPAQSLQGGPENQVEHFNSPTEKRATVRAQVFTFVNIAAKRRRDIDPQLPGRLTHWRKILHHNQSWGYNTMYRNNLQTVSFYFLFVSYDWPLASSLPVSLIWIHFT